MPPRDITDLCAYSFTILKLNTTKGIVSQTVNCEVSVLDILDFTEKMLM